MWSRCRERTFFKRSEISDRRVDALGHVKVRVKIRNPQEREREREVELLADTGAIYSIIPGRILEDLKIERRALRNMKLADGEKARAIVVIPEQEIYT